MNVDIPLNKEIKPSLSLSLTHTHIFSPSFFSLLPSPCLSLILALSSKKDVVAQLLYDKKNETNLVLSEQIFFNSIEFYQFF